MKYLLDTLVLLRAASCPEKLGLAICEQLEDPRNELYFSAASIWEIATKNNLNRHDFKVDVMKFRQSLLENEYEEIPIGSNHIYFTTSIADRIRDPFDRILIAQSWVEDITLLTYDPRVAEYPVPTQKI